MQWFRLCSLAHLTHPSTLRELFFSSRTEGPAHSTGVSRASETLWAGRRLDRTILVDKLTTEQRTLNMSRIHSRDTKPELIVRRLLHSLGFRFRLNGADLPGRPDIVLRKWRVAIFVNGCFWHGHECDLFRWPTTRPEFWREKILRNAERDLQNTEALLVASWRVVTIWECALKGKGRLTVDDLARRLENFIRSGLVRTDISGRLLVSQCAEGEH